MLQHQNLIANKHALFYRFDEKEKREQTIEHFKIFLGFADQTYFLKAQELTELQRQHLQLQFQIPRAEQQKEALAEDLKSALDDYGAISGIPLNFDVSQALQNPARALDDLRQRKVNVLSHSDLHVKQRQQFEADQNRITAELRKNQQKLASIRSSIAFAKGYVEEVAEVNVPSEAELHASICPFCNTAYAGIDGQANSLTDAIKWLNDELKRSSYLLESFEEEDRKTVSTIAETQSRLRAVEEKLTGMDKQIAELEQYRSQYELALKAKLRIEALLEQSLQRREGDLQRQLDAIDKKMRVLEDALIKKYDVINKLQNAQKDIQQTMSVLGAKFDFEESYRPIALHFDLRTFDLWHEKNDRRIFLRSMGSGANWLYCHLTLFLALHRFFCSLGERCLIPSTLFLDQPSQVYFPSIVDVAPEFNPTKLAEMEGEARKRPVDDDIKAVTNLYSQLVRFCKETLDATGIEPQIIVTDHADHLKLLDGGEFESFVRARWRTRGFIE
jgi:hypothetical protein